ncbi:MAG: hypothetical protein LBQ66_05225 [Planctomycetaceae bacterium]|nr:hypothetical protein [Planctomycetaceae bacterium]
MPLDLSFIIDDVCTPVAECSEYLFEEHERYGKMRLRVVVPQNSCRLNLSNDNIAFLLKKHKKCADGIIWEKINDSHYRLHIFELKKKIAKNFGNWIDVLKQFHGAYLRCRIISALTGVEFDSQIHLYTVYHQLGTGEDDNTDISTDRIMTDYPYNTVALQKAWEEDRCDLTSFGWLECWVTPAFYHHKIKLTNNNSDGVPEGIFNF